MCAKLLRKPAEGLTRERYRILREGSCVISHFGNAEYVAMHPNVVREVRGNHVISERDYRSASCVVIGE